MADFFVAASGLEWKIGGCTKAKVSHVVGVAKRTNKSTRTVFTKIKLLPGSTFHTLPFECENGRGFTAHNLTTRAETKGVNNNNTTNNNNNNNSRNLPTAKLRYWWLVPSYKQRRRNLKAC
jgi:hypothetical protein